MSLNPVHITHRQTHSDENCPVQLDNNYFVMSLRSILTEVSWNDLAHCSYVYYWKECQSTKVVFESSQGLMNSFHRVNLCAKVPFI